jgi:hypothetical protein
MLAGMTREELKAVGGVDEDSIPVAPCPGQRRDHQRSPP